MRCVTLAEKLRGSGANCFFVCKDHLGNYISFIRSLKFDVFELAVQRELPLAAGSMPDSGTYYGHWLGSDWKFDAAQTILKIKNIRVDLIIVDHYAIDYRWENELKTLGLLIMVIDDLANRPHTCDLLLDQNLGGKRAMYENHITADTEVLAGPKYSLLRQEFFHARLKKLSSNENRRANRVLVTMGAIDKDDWTGQVIDSISKLSYFSELEITVVLGLNAPWKEIITRRVKSFTNVMLLVNPSSMSDLMTKNDVAISAGGSTLWELCCLGLPTTIIVTAENQTKTARRLERLGAALLIDKKNLLTSTLAHLDSLLNDSFRRQLLSSNSSKIIDGQGCDRVINAMKDLIKTRLLKKI
jgi:UDP-2,4-diacetamido-2,4,6-trideoxy-beta-L-altropyranose hydrolase